MSQIWEPINGDFDCPGKRRLTVDELGVTIGIGKKATATAEWPRNNIRVCELVEGPYTLTQSIPNDVYQALILLLRYAEPSELASLRNILKEYYAAQDTLNEWINGPRSEEDVK